MADKKSILFCGNGMSGEAIKPIKGMGYTVYLITDFMNDKGVEDADRAVHAKTKDPTDALRAARALHTEGCRFDGVMSLCWDCAPSVTAIAEEFGLRSVSRASAEAATFKVRRSHLFSEAGVPAPKFAIVSSLEQAHAAREKIDLPLVFKPPDLSSAKGVILVEDIRDFETAFLHSSGFTDCGHLIVNEYLSGTEHSTEGLMIDGNLHPTGISDRVFKYSEHKPHFVEVGDIMPTVLNDAKIIEMFRVTEHAALALDIRNGVVKGDMIQCKDGRVRVLELAARLGGPRFGTEMVPLSNGTQILKAAVQQAVGDPINLDFLKPKTDLGMVNRSIFPKAGRVVSIDGLDNAKSLPGYYDFKWWKPDGLKPGDLITPPKYGCGNAGYIIVTGKTREEAITNADRIERTIVIKTE